MSDKQSQEVLSNELVRYSRAGDAFHYRFAARFCLDMINPKSNINVKCALGAISGAQQNRLVIGGEKMVSNIIIRMYALRICLKNKLQ